MTEEYLMIGALEANKAANDVRSATIGGAVTYISQTIAADAEDGNFSTFIDVNHQGVSRLEPEDMDVLVLIIQQHGYPIKRFENGSVEIFWGDKELEAIQNERKKR